MNYNYTQFTFRCIFISLFPPHVNLYFESPFPYHCLFFSQRKLLVLLLVNILYQEPIKTLTRKLVHYLNSHFIDPTLIAVKCDVTLLTLTCVGVAEGYYNHIFCLCVFQQNVLVVLSKLSWIFQVLCAFWRLLSTFTTYFLLTLKLNFKTLKNKQQSHCN